jgi:hypothetical protein
VYSRDVIGQEEMVVEVEVEATPIWWLAEIGSIPGISLWRAVVLYS